jgi:hypothetical protein
MENFLKFDFEEEKNSKVPVYGFSIDREYN